MLEDLAAHWRVACRRDVGGCLTYGFFLAFHYIETNGYPKWNHDFDHPPCGGIADFRSVGWWWCVNADAAMSSRLLPTLSTLARGRCKRILESEQ